VQYVPTQLGRAQGRGGGGFCLPRFLLISEVMFIRGQAIPLTAGGK
jgi:hypothetical protein